MHGCTDVRFVPLGNSSTPINIFANTLINIVTSLEKILVDFFSVRLLAIFKALNPFIELQAVYVRNKNDVTITYILIYVVLLKN